MIDDAALAVTKTRTTAAMTDVGDRTLQSLRDRMMRVAQNALRTV